MASTSYRRTSTGYRLLSPIVESIVIVTESKDVAIHDSICKQKELFCYLFHCFAHMRLSFIVGVLSCLVIILASTSSLILECLFRYDVISKIILKK